MADTSIGEERPAPPTETDDENVVLTTTLIAIAAIGIVCAVVAIFMWQGPILAAVPVTAGGTILLALLAIGRVLNK